MKSFVIAVIVAQAVVQSYAQVIRGGLLNPLISAPLLSSPCGNVIPSPCSNVLAPVLPNVISPNILASNLVGPNVLSANILGQNVLSSNVLGQNVLSSNVLGQNVLSSNVLGQNVLTSNVLSPNVIQSPSVANSLADTLSLLTVSSLLAESLPLGLPNVIAPQVLGSCGCGGYSYIL